MDAETLLQKINLGEDEDIEFKAANGGFPRDVWETLSAFANTDGGYIVLGVSQNKHEFEVSGIRNLNVILKTFWDSHNNEQKLSTPICSNSHVEAREIEGQKIIL